MRQGQPAKSPMKCRGNAELIEDGFVKTLTDAVGLRMSGLRFRMFNAAHAKEKLVIVFLHTAAVFRASIRQHSQDAHTLLFEEWQDFVIEHICGSDRRFGRVQLGRCPF